MSSWTVPAEEAGQRLDRYLAQRLEIPRHQIRRWIDEERVQVNAHLPKASRKVEEGDAIVCEPPQKPRETGLIAEEGPLEILYEDADLIVLNKPAGLAVHPGAGRDTGTLAHRLLAAFPDIAGVGGAERPGIVHRLDLDTTGVMVIARSPRAWEKLSKGFADREIDKHYVAIAYGTLKPAGGTIYRPIGRHRGDRKRMTVRGDGRPARTSYSTLAATAGISWLVLGLETGRTHQIRVHLKAVGHPLIGDPIYGEERWKALPRPSRAPLKNFPRPALHAWRLAFAHPVDDRPLCFTAPVPNDLTELWTQVAGAVPSLPEDPDLLP